MFHHTTDDLLKVMRILVLPVQIEFYFDTASHLYHLGTSNSLFRPSC
jgi:hypothetical protein